MIYDWQDAWLAMLNQDAMHEMGIDTYIVWDNCYTNRDKPTAGHYEFANPNLPPLLQELKKQGGRLLQYVGPGRWLAEGVTLFQLLGELDRHGWANGVAMDGTWTKYSSSATTLSEIDDFLGVLTDRMPGPHFLHHSVPDPFSGPENQDGIPLRFQPRAITRHFQWVMWGETNPGWPQSLDDPLWRYMISGAYRGYIGIYKPMERVGNPWETNHEWIKHAPDRLITYRCTRNRWEPKKPEWPNWRTHFYDSWKAARDLYVADPEAWIKARFGAISPAGPTGPPSPA